MTSRTSPSGEGAIAPPREIPDKLYFKIGEVSRITGVEPYVLRYWESEFDAIQPVKLRNQRRYRRRDIERILEIRHLLYDQRFTIAGAKKRLRELTREARPQPAPPTQAQLDLDGDSAEPDLRALLERVRAGLESIRKVLE
ncbi:MAG: MerR family transcriptional regulator [bacterium]